MAEAKPAAKATADKKIESFFTRDTNKGTPVSLWVLERTSAKAPAFDGKIGTKRVAAFIRKGSKGPFLALVGPKPKDGEDKDRPQLGRANIVVTDKGIPKLAIELEGQAAPIWASIRKTTPEALLIECGFDKDKIAAKKAAYEIAKATAAEAKAQAKAAPKP